MSQRYDQEFCIYPFGLVNSGITCWFNSILQMIISSPSVCKQILYLYIQSKRGAAQSTERGAAQSTERGAAQSTERGAAQSTERGAAQSTERGAAQSTERGAAQSTERGAAQIAERGAGQGAAQSIGQKQFHTRRFVLAIVNLLKHELYQAGRVTSAAQTTFTYDIIEFKLASLLEDGRGKGTGISGIFGYNMEDAYEGFLSVLEALGHPNINSLFTTIYNCTMICANCNHTITTTDTNVVIVLNQHVPDICNYLISHKTKIPDYKCDHCSVVGSTEQIRKLKSVSTNIVIVFANKYLEKTILTIPPQLNIGDLTYKLIAQVEHSGATVSRRDFRSPGGHYWALGTRMSQTGTPITCVFNDTSVSPCKFESTPNTYMVLYHLV
jgi:hypothetical protein